MDHSGVVVPNKLASYNWERCPDWDGRMVLRLSQGSSHWLVWQGPLELFASIDKCELPPDYNWQWLSIEKPSGILSELNVGFLVDNKLRSVWLAVELVNLQSVDLLVDRFGLPPQEVYRDWQYQIETSGRSSRSSLDALSHVLVLPDGRLVSISSIESLIKKSVLNPIHFRLLDYPQR